MSDENRLQTEEELWDVLSAPVVTDPAPKSAPKPKPVPKPKTEGRFARPEPAPVKAEPEPEQEKKEGRKFDGFFFACMAAVAAVSVALTLVIGSMTGSEKAPVPTEDTIPIVTIDGEKVAVDVLELLVEELTEENETLRLENDQLREQVQLQAQQLNDLLSKIEDLTGSPAELPTTPGGTASPQQTEQAQARELFKQVQAAYADFDRAKLDELIPQMDQLVRHLSTDDLNEYYLILEYVEQPSNG